MTINSAHRLRVSARIRDATLSNTPATASQRRPVRGNLSPNADPFPARTGRSARIHSSQRDGHEAAGPTIANGSVLLWTENCGSGTSIDAPTSTFSDRRKVRNAGTHRCSLIGDYPAPGVDGNRRQRSNQSGHGQRLGRHSAARPAVLGFYVV